MQLHQLLNSAVAALDKAGVEQARLEAELLLQHCLHLSRSGLFLRLDTAVAIEDAQQFEELLRRRCRREPLQYITGNCEFWSLEFAVTPAVLIPRPETEFLLEHALATLDVGREEELFFLDLCTGSGVIGIVLALEFARARVAAVDLSFDALEVARQNIAGHGVGERVLLFCSDLMSALADRVLFDCIVTNPPYVKAVDLPGLQPEVREWEPHLALSGGADGMEFIRRISVQAASHLLPGGWLFMEIGADIEAPVRDLLQTSRQYDRVRVVPDLSGLPRVLQARRRS